MGQATQPYKRSFAGSVGAGVKSVFGGEGRRYYTLVHKVTTKYHKAGESQPIIVDEIELGRDPSCQVRFDENFQTVSRRHAAIVREGENWKLVQLSKTNPTYLNGRPVQSQWYLQNGDEIQLSTNGPKLGFIIPEGKKGLVSSLNLTSRLNLFRQQALRPYKQALTALSCILLLVIGCGGYFLWDAHAEVERLQAAERESAARLAAYQREAQAAIDSLIRMANQSAAKIEELVQENKRQRVRIKDLEDYGKVNQVVDNDAINKALPHVYFIQTYKFSIRLPDGTEAELECGKPNVPGWTGTGFLLEDGRFVTARHVTEGWYFWYSGGEVDSNMLGLNEIVMSGGRVVCHFIAISSSGSHFEFTSDEFTCDRSHDEVGTWEDGNRVSLARLGATDYAYMQTSRSGGLPFDAPKSSRLDRGTKLTVLGFPLGLGANAIDDINPVYGSGICSTQGLNQGMILTTDTNYEQGNSGGPVFYTDENGRLVVVGIVSAGAGRVTGFVVPLLALR